MDLVRHKSTIDVKELRSYLENPTGDKIPSWESSQLYSSSRNEKFMDEDLRQSSFRVFTDETLFKHVDKIVQEFNKTDPTYNYILRKNDITHIHYQTGGFFKKHRDFLSSTSNLVEEFTLLVCVTPDDIAKVTTGGDTTIFTYNKSHTFDTHTPGCGLVFRKDLEHEGTAVAKGEKYIVTANLWATRKDHTEQVLLVTFPKHATDSEVDGDGQQTGTIETKPSIQKAACSETSYVLPVHVLSGVLQTHVEWANRRAEDLGQDPPSVVEYPCTNFDFEAFGVVAKILKRAYVDESSLLKHAECMDYFGPFPTEHLLVNLALEQKDNSDNDDSKTHMLEETATDKKKVKTDTEGQQPEPSLVTEDLTVIVCENDARMKAVMNVARLLDEPYVPFKMLFVEGVLGQEGDIGADAVDIPMCCALVLVGEHHNIFSCIPMARLNSPETYTLKGLHQSQNLIEAIAEFCPESAKQQVQEKLQNVGESGEWFYSKPFDETEDTIRYLLEWGYGLGLMLGFGSDPNNVTKAVTEYVFGKRGTYYGGEHMVILPGNREEMSGDNGEEPKPKRQKTPDDDVEENDIIANEGEPSEIGKSSTQEDIDDNDSISPTSGKEPPLGKKRESVDGDGNADNDRPKSKEDTVTDKPSPVGPPSLFHRDKNGLTVFTQEEAERASNFIAELNLEDRVKASLQQTRFDLPQQTGGVDAHFCNESVYGNVNILWVSGVLRLDGGSKAAISSPVADVKLTVWPTAEAQADNERKRVALQKLRDTDPYGDVRIY